MVPRVLQQAMLTAKTLAKQKASKVLVLCHLNCPALLTSCRSGLQAALPARLPFDLKEASCCTFSSFLTKTHCPDYLQYASVTAMLLLTLGELLQPALILVNPFPQALVCVPTVLQSRTGGSCPQSAGLLQTAGSCIAVLQPGQGPLNELPKIELLPGQPETLLRTCFDMLQAAAVSAAPVHSGERCSSFCEAAGAALLCL